MIVCSLHLLISPPSGGMRSPAGHGRWRECPQCHYRLLGKKGKWEGVEYGRPGKGGNVKGERRCVLRPLLHLALCPVTVIVIRRRRVVSLSVLHFCSFGGREEWNRGCGCPVCVSVFGSSEMLSGRHAALIPPRRNTRAGRERESTGEKQRILPNIPLISE